MWWITVRRDAPWWKIRIHRKSKFLSTIVIYCTLGSTNTYDYCSCRCRSIRFHGRNTKGHYWYNYLYSKEGLKLWVQKVEQIRKETKVLRAYFNNHYGGKAIINALQFKQMLGNRLSENEISALERAQKYMSNIQSTLPVRWNALTNLNMLR